MAFCKYLSIRNLRGSVDEGHSLKGVVYEDRVVKRLIGILDSVEEDVLLDWRCLDYFVGSWIRLR